MRVCHRPFNHNLFDQSVSTTMDGCLLQISNKNLPIALGPTAAPVLKNYLKLGESFHQTVDEALRTVTGAHKEALPQYQGAEGT